MLKSADVIVTCCFVFFNWFTPIISYTQSLSPDTSFLATAQKRNIELYAKALQDQSRLYNGSDYSIYQSKEEEHPYFVESDWVYGSIIYEQEVYENIPLLYDIREDKVITENNRGNPIKLLDQKIQQFTMLNRTFIRLTRADTINISEGFYDQLYNGAVKAYARHTKVYQESLNQREVVPRFDEKTQYYIVKDRIFHVVKTKTAVLKVLSDRKAEIKDFIRKNRIKFKTNREEAIKSITEFYDKTGR